MFFYNEAKALFSEASVSLREWVSNSDEVNIIIPTEPKLQSYSDTSGTLRMIHFL